MLLRMTDPKAIVRGGYDQALETMGCDRYQGYLLSPPLAPTELTSFMKARTAELAP